MLDGFLKDSGPGAARVIPPHNLEVEQGLLGALMVSDAAIDEVADILIPNYFYSEQHGRIFEVIKKIYDGGSVASPALVAPHFRDEDLPDGYIADLAENVISVVNAADYARYIRDCHMRRALMAAAADIHASAADEDIDATADAKLEFAEGLIFGLGESGPLNGPVSMAAGTDEALQYIDRARRGEWSGVKTGIAALDDKMVSLEDGNLYVLAGRPSMGKTAGALTVAYNVARSCAGDDTGGALFFSMEMSSMQLSQRLIARETGIDTDAQRNAQSLTDAEFGRLIEAKAAIDMSRLYVDDTPRLAVDQIRARARRMKRLNGIGLIVVDYLHLVKPDNPMAMRHEQLSQITKDLKAMAKELRVPVIVLSQLSRAVEQREDKRPQMSDLREAGAIEEDADVVMFVYREEYYLEREEPEQKPQETAAKFGEKLNDWKMAMQRARGKVDIIFGKNRQSTVGIVRLGFDGARQVFFDLNAGGRS